MTTNAGTTDCCNPPSPPPLLPLLYLSPVTVCIFGHLCGRQWVSSFVSLISCLSVARFNFKSSSTHFHEWVQERIGLNQDRTGHSTGHGCTGGPRWDRQLTMLSRNFTRRWFRANEFDSIVSSFFPHNCSPMTMTTMTMPLTCFWQSNCVDNDGQRGRGGREGGEIEQPEHLASCRDRQPQRNSTRLASCATAINLYECNSPKLLCIEY